MGEQKYVKSVNGMNPHVMFNLCTIINKSVKQMGFCNVIGNQMHFVRTHVEKKGKVILLTHTVVDGLSRRHQSFWSPSAKINEFLVPLLYQLNLVQLILPPPIGVRVVIQTVNAKILWKPVFSVQASMN